MGDAPQEAPRSPRGTINFAYERQRHAGFVGRTALLARLDQELIQAAAQRWVVVTGGPGMGKSAVLAAWLARREAAGDMVPHHFIRRGWANWDNPEALVGSLVAPLEAGVPEARELEADARLAPAARLAAALVCVSERTLVPRDERLVLVIDGLDEYDPRPGSLPGDPLGAFLPYTLPRGVRVQGRNQRHRERGRHPGPGDVLGDHRRHQRDDGDRHRHGRDRRPAPPSRRTGDAGHAVTGGRRSERQVRHHRTHDDLSRRRGRARPRPSVAV